MELVYYIEYLNKDKGFKIDRITFTGPNAHQDCVRWGQENLENFNRDMVKIEFVDTFKED
ncbi:MAG: hypothetical protein K9I70_05965 [Chitinophagaceae bacterium]|jgi:hypothetical protein|nr:hypothetical protein [Chitinophagaceae bacterium]